MSTITANIMNKIYMRSAQTVTYHSVVKALGRDPKGVYICLLETIFHPQGGGQPFDIGKIAGVSVLSVHKTKTGEGPDAFEINHYISDEFEKTFTVGQEVDMEIDMERRKLHARLHSAGHLIAAVAEAHFPEIKAINGHHFPKECRVEFTKTSAEVSMPDPKTVEAYLIAKLPEVIAADLPVAVLIDDSGRRIQIKTFPPVPCGGTHVASVGEISSINIRKGGMKSGLLRIGYDVGET